LLLLAGGEQFSLLLLLKRLVDEAPQHRDLQPLLRAEQLEQEVAVSLLEFYLRHQGDELDLVELCLSDVVELLQQLVNARKLILVFELYATQLGEQFLMEDQLVALNPLLDICELREEGLTVDSGHLELVDQQPELLVDESEVQGLEEPLQLLQVEAKLVLPAGLCPSLRLLVNRDYGRAPQLLVLRLLRVLADHWVLPPELLEGKLPVYRSLGGELVEPVPS